MTYLFTADQYVVAPYGYYDDASGILYSLGFTHYDKSLNLNCDCKNAVISGTPVLSNLTVSQFGSSNITVETSQVTNTVQNHIGISGFCGDYHLTMTRNGNTFLPAFVTACEKNCGTKNNYQLAVVAPLDNTTIGLN